MIHARATRGHDAFGPVFGRPVLDPRIDQVLAGAFDFDGGPNSFFTWSDKVVQVQDSDSPSQRCTGR